MSYDTERYDMIQFLKVEEKRIFKKIEEYEKKRKTDNNTKRLSELVDKIFRVWSLIDTFNYFTQPVTDENIYTFIQTVEKHYLDNFNNFKLKITKDEWLFWCELENNEPLSNEGNLIKHAPEKIDLKVLESIIIRYYEPVKKKKLI